MHSLSQSESGDSDADARDDIESELPHPCAGLLVAAVLPPLRRRSPVSAKNALLAATEPAQKAGVLLGCGAVIAAQITRGVCYGGGDGARAASSLGTRQGPAPSSQQGEQRRRAMTARAVTATSAQKADALLGCGAVMGSAEHAR